MDVADSQQSLAERLGAWLGWTDAISLSSLLNGGASPAQAQPDAAFSMAWALAGPGESMHAVATAQTERVRTELSRSINLDSVLMPAKPSATARHAMPGLPPAPALPLPALASEGAASDSEGDFLPYRRSYAKHQRAMGTRIASLRIDLRSALAQASPTLGRLAALDAAMDEMLGVHERGLLSTVPRMLQKRFEQLHRAQRPEASPGRQPAWQQGFGRDMQAVLLAELEIRMQPVDGLLEALGQTSAPQHAAPQGATLPGSERTAATRANEGIKPQ